MFKRRIESDLLAIDVLTLLLIFLIITSLASWLRTILGFPFILFFPGYVITATLFPAKETISNSTRLALSIGLSIIAVILIGLALSYSPWYLKLSSLLASLSIFVLVLSIFAWYLRGRISSLDRYTINLQSPVNTITAAWSTSDNLFRSLVIILSCAIVIGTGFLAHFLTNPDTEMQPYTQFYVLGEGGQASNYPRDLTAGKEATIVLGIVNRENRQTEYDLQITLGKDIIQSPSPIQLSPDEKWEQPITFTAQRTGSNQALRFVLCDDMGSPCEIRDLRINVHSQTDS